MRPTIIFTDGAARRNPGPGGWGAIIVTPDEQVLEIGGAEAHTTNNKMEMTGALQALARVRQVPGPVVLHTDSSYLIQGITQWIRGWQRKGWTTASGQPVLNRELWQGLDALVKERGKENAVSWRHVRGHAGIAGNERCDEIATGLADGLPVELYRGPLAGYPLDVESTTPAARSPSLRAKGSSPSSRGSAGNGSKPYSYLSLVGGELARHATWAECERRVRGVSGAKFKKATSRADEEAIARGWGCAPLP
ncbi:MAG TPA: viroplasmin family protein [Terriglobales bacterium]|nr:viroplasmin family protein [Terriglobales bacterium]